MTHFALYHNMSGKPLSHPLILVGQYTAKIIPSKPVNSVLGIVTNDFPMRATVVNFPYLLVGGALPCLVVSLIFQAPIFGRVHVYLGVDNP